MSLPGRNPKAAISFVNYTDTVLNVSFDTHSVVDACELTSGASIFVPEFDQRKCSQLLLSAPSKLLESSSNYIVWLEKRVRHGRKWAVLHSDSPWRIYQLKHSRRHYKIFIFPDRPLQSWMKDLPDSVLLSNLCLPGTHETMALYGWPFSQCQDLTVSEQLRHGIRMIDIRIVLVDGELRAYHGMTPERATFTSILEAVCSFLKSEEGQSETVIMSIMEEASFMPSSPLFSSLVYDAITKPPSEKSMWYLENRIPTLGEVRSKIVLFSRFGNRGDWDTGFGIHPTTWPDNRQEGFEWELESTRVRTQDWYGIPSFLSIPEKFAIAVERLKPCVVPDGKNDLSITFLSAARVPFALPSTVACGFGWASLNLGIEGVNSRVGRWLLGQLGGDGRSAISTNQVALYSHDDRASELTLVGAEYGSEKAKCANGESTNEPRLRGWVLMDFLLDPYELGIVPLLIECNWRGRVDGEEGWVS